MPPWMMLCVCGHEMFRHILDLELDPAVDCTVGECECPEFTVAR